MNDRFRFRAKRLDNNKFVYGYLCFIYIDNEKHCKIYSPDDAMSYDCYTETLGQCTGLKDKNDKLIYEGDIVKSTYSEIMQYLIYWEGRGYRMRVYGSDNKIVDDCPIFINAADVLEVIGNIHENADLLVGGK